MRRLSTIMLLLTLALLANAQRTYYYKLLSITENGNTRTNVSGGQFVSFIGDICYESNSNGVGVGNGQMKRTSSDNAQQTYSGTSYMGQKSYFRFTADCSELRAANSDASIVYRYVRSTAPSGVTTSSLIGRLQTKTGYSSGSGDSYVSPPPTIINNGGDNKQSSTKTRHQCRVCHGSGQKVKETYSHGRFMFCATCGREVPTGHLHVTCDNCHGTGYLEY